MKALKYKSLIIAASFVVVAGLTSESVFAQRGGGSRGGGNSGSRGAGASIGRSGGSVGRSSGSIGRSTGSINRSSSGINRNSGNITRGNGNVGRSSGYSGRGNDRIAGRYGRPGNNRSAYGRPGYGRPVYGRPGYGRPGYYRPGYRRSYYGFYGRPNYGYYNYYRPYLGFSFNVLPFGYYPFMFGADQFYYSGGLFYRQYDNQYKVVDPPVGAEIKELPEDAREIVINGQTFFEYKGVYYTAVQNAEGKTVYTVAGKDGVLNTDADAEGIPEIGEVVTELPEGSNEVVLKGERYFVSPDHVYYEEVVDGTTVTYRVVGH